MRRSPPPGVRDVPSLAHPAYAGRGIGRALLAADDALRGAACEEAFLFVHELNERAIAVYTATGYHPDRSVRDSDFRGTSLRGVRLVKQLWTSTHSLSGRGRRRRPWSSRRASSPLSNAPDRDDALVGWP
jgi:hypothetical protein